MERFKDHAQDYELYRQAVPYYDKAQQIVADSITRYMDENGKSKITALDIGVGCGHTTDAILNANPGVEIIGIDIESKMLTVAYNKLEDHLKSGAAVLSLGDAETFMKQYLDRSIDAMVSAYTLHNNTLDEIKGILAQAYRCLTPDGIMVIADKIAPESIDQHTNEITQELVSYRYFLNIDRPDLFEYWIEHMLRDEQSDLKLHERDLLTELHKLGFESKQIGKEGMLRIYEARKA